jgi:hypothetical protein
MNCSGNGWIVIVIDFTIGAERREGKKREMKQKRKYTSLPLD